ncbi:hypothetical protein EPUS_02669 [Endocarpon pusillum Z07020]|uniref:Uncharacterized protein n=1 Tax=Endocarpon pusillum (strain Z07020 / HMAS-L-300199) TaxID=1263415 RepID=U1GGZ5_ENDPU|nr:uncharacterized protein EPUS_02669 [Endocarpon pusillum Z07020]ERF76957.1 hypothetical protein EPUS_02669 [Endocarpon pusillum Z07020]
MDKKKAITARLAAQRLLDATTDAAKTLQKAGREIECAALLLWEEIPAWQQDGNQFMETGYRPPADGSYRKCLKSWTYIHNETGNIFFHLIGSLLFFTLPIGVYKELAPRYATADRADVFVFATFFSGVAICFALSTLLHTVMNHSEEGANFGVQLDYLRILLLIVNCSFGGMRGWWRTSGGFEWGFAITLRPGFRSPHLKSDRVLENRHSGAELVFQVSLRLEVEYETPLNTWARQDDRPHLIARLARAAHELPSGGAINKYDSMYPRSIGQRTSIAVHARSDVPSTTASDNIPQLTRGDSSASSISSADTDLASALDGMRILESVDGVLQVPDTSRPHADLICPWQILDCEETFNDIRVWKTHVFAHFRGHQCPETATCFLCERVFDQSPRDDSARAWNEMLSHMATEHFRGMGQRLATIRIDFNLMRWMYNRRIITPVQFRATQLLPRPTVLAESTGEVVNMPEAPMAPSPASPSSSPPVEQSDVYTVQASPRRERRPRSRARTGMN